MEITFRNGIPIMDAYPRVLIVGVSWKIDNINKRSNIIDMITEELKYPVANNQRKAYYHVKCYY